MRTRRMPSKTSKELVWTLPPICTPPPWTWFSFKLEIAYGLLIVFAHVYAGYVVVLPWVACCMLPLALFRHRKDLFTCAA